MITKLFIDLDDTVIRFKNPTLHNTGSLMDVILRYAMTCQGYSAEDANRKCKEVSGKRWWSWSDFITDFRFDPKDFWEYAYDYERTYLAPAEEHLQQTLEFLKKKVQLYVTSNNPQDGILHKLRLANVSPDIFDDLLGATRMQAMKKTPAFWENVLHQLHALPQECAVVGDDIRDDSMVPKSTGIPLTFLVTGKDTATHPLTPGVQQVKCIADIKELL